MARKFSEAFEVRHPFFKPAWRRVLAVLACFLWSVFEISTGAYVWASVFIAAGAYLFWQFFVCFKPEDYQKKDN